MPTSLYSRGQDLVIRSTTNYDQFSFDPANRPISQVHLMNLYDAVEANNLLREFPILVDSDMTIIDGQHRLKVAESLGVPIYFIVSDRISVDHVASTNSHTLSWASADYLHRWCTAGKIEYLKLRRFREEYPFIPLSTAMNLCFFGDRVRGRRLLKRFQDGDYECNDMPYARRVARAVLDFAEYPHVKKFYGTQSFINAVAQLIGNCEYDHSVMMNRMRYKSVELVRCANIDDYMIVFNGIYNYRTRAANRVHLEKLYSGDPRWRVDRK